jgi:predicted TPR repeat methyltransferase
MSSPPDRDTDDGTCRSLTNALTIAVALHQGGDLDDAEARYRRILDDHPDQSDALNFLGVLVHQRGQTKEGIGYIQRSIERNPDHSTAFTNLGNLFDEIDEPQKAMQAYTRACELDPADPVPQRNLALLLEEYRRLGDAADAYSRVIALHPDDAAARKRLGEVLYRDHRAPDAAAAMRAWLEHEPDHPIATHCLAAYEQRDVPTRAADAYVRIVFAAAAATFDADLEHLAYRAPGLLAQALHQHLGSASRERTVLDAGCGTGLCGPMLRPYSSRLVGIDLSPPMLEMARQRDLYDELAEAELTEFLGRGEPGYDLVACIDTLIYFGDLASLASGFSRVLRARGYLVLTLEAPGAPEQEAAFRLTGTGRYVHTLAHARDALEAAGLEVVGDTQAVLRRENRQDVDGHVVVARKRGEQG